eukprot:TRINITY_DN2816_c0_g1_i3.p1 TRINITY_DN2816_c0_g1~~TRINITY_DN2816_c0_g1_i3.p1  ORF type:complete len:155 (-),score=73.40 TRINITY_DN2816_c0_g1_i3:25-444(-)
MGYQRRGPSRYREKKWDESSEDDTSSYGTKDEMEDTEEKRTTRSPDSNKRPKEVRGPTRYRDKNSEESSEEETSSSNEDTGEHKAEDIRGTEEDDSENTEAISSKTKPEQDEISKSLESMDSDESGRNQNEDEDREKKS